MAYDGTKTRRIYLFANLDTGGHTKALPRSSECLYVFERIDGDPSQARTIKCSRTSK